MFISVTGTMSRRPHDSVGFLRCWREREQQQQQQLLVSHAHILKQHCSLTSSSSQLELHICQRICLFTFTEKRKINQVPHGEPCTQVYHILRQSCTRLILLMSTVNTVLIPLHIGEFAAAAAAGTLDGKKQFKQQLPDTDHNHFVVVYLKFNWKCTAFIFNTVQ